MILSGGHVLLKKFQPESPDAGRGRRRKSHSHVWRVSECVHELTTAPRSPQVSLTLPPNDACNSTGTHFPFSEKWPIPSMRRQEQILNLIWIKIPSRRKAQKKTDQCAFSPFARSRTA